MANVDDKIFTLELSFDEAQCLIGLLGKFDSSEKTLTEKHLGDIYRALYANNALEHAGINCGFRLRTKEGSDGTFQEAYLLQATRNDEEFE